MCISWANEFHLTDITTSTEQADPTVEAAADMASSPNVSPLIGSQGLQLTPICSGLLSCCPKDPTHFAGPSSLLSLLGKPPPSSSFAACDPTVNAVMRLLGEIDLLTGTWGEGGCTSLGP